MKCVIFCGGKGTRLREETEFRPKPLVEVGGKPIIWHIMKIYNQSGIKNFVLPIGYKGDMIKRYFMEYKWLNNDFTLKLKNHEIQLHGTDTETDDWEISCIDTGIESMTGLRLYRVKDYLKDEEEFCLTYGDGVSNVNINEIIKYHHKHKKMITITGVHALSKYGQMIIDKDNFATDFKEKPVLHDYINGGYMVINKKIWDYLPNENIMFESLLPKFAQMNEVKVYNFDGFWKCMDTFQDVEDLNKIWEKDHPWKIW